MRTLIRCGLAMFVAIAGASQAQSAKNQAALPDSAREKLVGAWRLAWMEEPGADGKLNRITSRKGMLLYTRDGHMSVQIMFPKSESALSNDYVQNGYEASFGSYDVDEGTHTVTHHVQGALVRSLIGKNLTRVYRFEGKQLILKSSRPDEHWTIAWEHN